MLNKERNTVIFNGKTNLPQRGVFTKSSLTPAEFEIATAVVNWDRPDRFNRYIFDVTGRSFFYRSPDYSHLGTDDMLQRRYSGLQIIGAGGSPRGLIQGVYNPDGEIQVYPVNPTNSSTTLVDILQQREIDEYGNLVLWTKEYSPLYGMDFKESSARKRMTLFFNRVVDSATELNLHPFITPVLAAEGYFPEKLADKGLPLQFQVFRVPVVNRFPSQLIDIVLKRGIEAALQAVSKFSFLMGRTERVMHALKIAYMDNHPNNASLIEGSTKDTVFITDLGSCMDFSGSRYPKRYMGFDFLMYMITSKMLFEHIIPYASTLGLTSNQKSEVSDFLTYAACGFTGGYLESEITNSLPNNFSGEDFSELAMKKAGPILIRSLTSPAQQFLEFMEEYLTANTD